MKMKNFRFSFVQTYIPSMQWHISVMQSRFSGKHWGGFVGFCGLKRKRALKGALRV